MKLILLTWNFTQIKEMKFKNIFERFAYINTDTDDQRFSKNLIIIISVSCCFFGLIWGLLYYLFLGYGLTMFLPWLFVVLIGIAIPIAHFKRNHYILVNAQLMGITWISALVDGSILVDYVNNCGSFTKAFKWLNSSYGCFPWYILPNECMYHFFDCFCNIAILC